MKTVYLIRHGQPDFPDGRRLCLGRTDIPLGPEGIAQARAMAEALPPVTAVFSSPLSRAMQTAGAIGMPVTVLPGLREMDAGQWDGLSFDQIRQQFPALYTARGTDPTLPLPGGEPDAIALARFRNALCQAAAQAPGDLAVVAHGGVISLLLEAIAGRRHKPGYAQVIALSWENGQFTCKEEL